MDRRNDGSLLVNQFNLGWMQCMNNTCIGQGTQDARSGHVHAVNLGRDWFAYEASLARIREPSSR